MAEIESLATQEPLAKHLQRHRTDRLIMLSDGVFAIATTLAALEIRLPEHPPSLGMLLHESGQSLVAYLLSFLVTAVFWIANRELFARVDRTDNVLTALSLGLLCGIAILPAAVHVFYQPGGLAVGFQILLPRHDRVRGDQLCDVDLCRGAARRNARRNPASASAGRERCRR